MTHLFILFKKWEYSLTKYFILALNVGQKYEQFTIFRCFEKYAIFKTIYLKIE